MAPRPLRADARRNQQKIVEAAATAFAESGTAISLDEIAERAGVGSATLYRRFPTRAALFEAVYVEQVEVLLAPPEDPPDPREALESWLRRFVDFIVSKRAFAEEMAHDTELVHDARRRIYAVADPLVIAAQRAELVNNDITADDILRMLSGVGLADYPDPHQIDRVVNICLRGLRPTVPSAER